MKTLEDLKQASEKIWSSIKGEIHKRFNDGYATCTFATYEVVKTLKDFDIKVVDGVYKGDPHWFPLVTVQEGSYIVDLGNNLDSKAIETGDITPRIIKQNLASDYDIDEEMSVHAFLNYYPTIKNF